MIEHDHVSVRPHHLKLNCENLERVVIAEQFGRSAAAMRMQHRIIGEIEQILTIIRWAGKTHRVAQSAENPFIKTSASWGENLLKQPKMKV